MALLKIAEPGQSTPAARPRRRAVGIDLGTTYSLVATVEAGQVKVLSDSDGGVLLPSVVHYRAEGLPEVGVAAQSLAIVDPLNTIASVKRLMGQGMAAAQRLSDHPLEASANGMPYLRTAAGNKSPVEVSAEILRALAERAERHFNETGVAAVITVPAYFDDAQRQATKDAARLAGIELLRLLNEPTAAAIAYGLDQNAEGVIAVYDLGGGTFDISILRLSRGVFEVLATGGDSQLGGDDFDRRLAQWLLSETGHPEPLTPAESRHLLGVARAAKERLSEQVQTTVELNEGNLCWQGVLTRSQFEQLIGDEVERTLRACRRALRDSGCELKQIDEVVMVGGSSRVPVVRERVEALFGRTPRIDIDPERVVAMGAARQADLLAGNAQQQALLLLDVIPLSLGIETMGGLVERIIPRNSPIPVSRAQEFTTHQDGQTAMSIHVVQGERDLVEECRSLARFVLRGIPPMSAGAARIRVTYQVDADGLLSVSATELTSGVASSIEVKPSYGLGEEEILRMLRDSRAFAAEDMRARALREQRIAADALLQSLDHALTQDGDKLLAATERQQLLQQMARLRTLMAGDDPQQIALAVEQLNRESQSFAERRMDLILRSALAGKSIEEVKG
ncbi:MAG TPA: Fe-S protein assembly chaperone HscA [Pseudomonadales bacterium]|jgi:molecular chaperone HscA|nr:Fe-S protein assembly chaperone HscA [Pseudomonadales bacterium]HMU89305.1 Fe-S protein assembly chaperone HscA [Pseudomonadales bacterium]HMW15101.1 Fe-S protein assembly chaperone HscA [Pseudomonadales bacterium]HMW82197.1 Fe-S protein assembly chaperone HscA [Pseudomonadales bacterium]HMY96088.1 Fe-S protein assembly chaperone HscA [Pseudomonadales bacterium]